MEMLWKLPRSVRNALENKKKQLKKDILTFEERIAHLEPWLANVKALKASTEKELAELENKYK